MTGRLVVATYPDAQHAAPGAVLEAQAEFRDLGFTLDRQTGKVALILFGRDAQGRALEATKLLEPQVAQRLLRELERAIRPSRPDFGAVTVNTGGDDPSDMFAARRTQRDGE
jgi:hypothetical protein